VLVTVLEGKNPEISGIQAVNDQTLKITFDEPNAAFVYMLTNPMFWVYDLDDQVVPAPGTGQFVLQKNENNQKFILSRNERYHLALHHCWKQSISLYLPMIIRLWANTRQGNWIIWTPYP
jgi:ABC-type transport system substrate-binding protein